MKVDGQCVCQVTMDNGLSLYLRFLVVPFQEDPLLGLGACQHLGLIGNVAAFATSPTPSQDDAILEGAGVSHPGINKVPVAKEFIDVFGGVGCVKEFPYRIAMDPTAQPYAIPAPRRVPLPYIYMTRVREELERMKTIGVIVDTTEPTEWVSPMVVAPKSNGTVRIAEITRN